LAELLQAQTRVVERRLPVAVPLLHEQEPRAGAERRVRVGGRLDGEPRAQALEAGGQVRLPLRRRRGLARERQLGALGPALPALQAQAAQPTPGAAADPTNVDQQPERRQPGAMERGLVGLAWPRLHLERYPPTRLDCLPLVRPEVQRVA